MGGYGGRRWAKGVESREETEEEGWVRGERSAREARRDGGRERNEVGETSRGRQRRGEARQGQKIQSPGPWNA